MGPLAATLFSLSSASRSKGPNIQNHAPAPSESDLAKLFIGSAESVAPEPGKSPKYEIVWPTNAPPNKSNK